MDETVRLDQAAERGTAGVETRTALSTTSVRMSGSVLGILTGLALVVAFTETMLIPSLYEIGQEYSASPTEAAWIPAIFLVVAAASVPVVGKLGDIYGRKRMLVVVMSIYSVGAIVNGFTWNLSSLLVCRALEGVGLAMFPLAFALIHDELAGSRLPLATALVSGMNSAGSALGLLGGALISDQFGWQATYRLVGPPAAVLTVLFAVLAVEATSREKEGIDYIGAGLFAVGIGLLLVGLTEGPVLGWASSATIAIFVAAAVLIVVFLVQELRTRYPIMNLRLPHTGTMMKTNVLMFIAGASFYFAFEGVTYFAEGPEPALALNVTDTGLIMLPGALLMIVFALLSGVLMRRMGIRLPMIVSMILFIAGFGLLLEFHASAYEVALGFVPIVVGVAMMFNCVVNAILVLAPPQKVGAQNGTLSVFQYVGQSVAAAIAGAALVLYVSPLTLEPTSRAYAVIGIAGIVTAVVGLIVLATYPRLILPDSPNASSS